MKTLPVTGAGKGVALPGPKIISVTDIDVLPAIVSVPSTGGFSEALAAGAVIRTLSAVPAGATRTWSAEGGGKVVLNTAKTALVRGATAVTLAETISGTVTDTKAGASNSPVTLAVSMVVEAAISSLLYNYQDYAKPVIGSPVSGVAFVPAVNQPATGNDLVGFNFNTAGGVALSARLGSFAHYFPDGVLDPTDNIDAFWSGSAHLMQMDVKRTHASGKVAHAIFTGQFPALTAGQTINAMLRKGATALSGSTVDMSAMTTAAIAANFSMVSRYAKRTEPPGSVPIEDRETWWAANETPITTLTPSYSFTPAEALAADGTPNYWMQGKVATQRRFIKNLIEGLRIILDATCYSDGTIDLEYQLMGDVQFYTNPQNTTSWVMTTLITQGGTTVFNAANQRIFIGCGLSKRIFTGVAASLNAPLDPHEHNIQFDCPYLSQIGAIPNYDYQSGLNNSAIAAYTTNYLGYINWRGPLSFNGISTPNMGGPGDRPDIGILMGGAADYFRTMHVDMKRVIIGQSEAARALLINHYDPVRGQNLNIFPTIGRPGYWISASAGPDIAGAVWEWFNRSDWDTAHQPMMAYAGYLITGRRGLWDLLQNQANFTIGSTYANSRTHTVAGVTKDWVITQNNQIREAGWCMRDVAMALYLCPDSSVFKQPWTDLIKFNFDLLNTRRLTWAPIQGQPFGWLAQANPYDSFTLKPWMQDHVIAGFYMAWLTGSVEAREYIAQFAYNFTVERGNQADGVFYFKKGGKYYYPINTSNDIAVTGVDADTWAELDAGGVANWEDGNYSILWLRSLALVHNMLKDTTNAAIVTDRILTNNAPFTDLASRRTGGADRIVPLVLD